MAEINIVVMGVAGCGKTTIGEFLATQLGYAFIDSDDYHPKANVEKMSRGEPLTDEDRYGWLTTLQALLAAHEAEGTPIVLACSALKQQYREMLRTPGGPLFVYLKISPKTAKTRLEARRNHFMPASLITSQFATLEPPNDAITVDANQPLADVKRLAITEYNNYFSSGSGDGPEPSALIHCAPGPGGTLS